MSEEQRKTPAETEVNQKKIVSNNSTFDPNKHMLNLKGKQYLPVAARIAWMRTEHPDWTIKTVIKKSAEGAVIMKATIKDETGRLIATAHKMETKAGFADYIEKAETGAIGRALGMCGYGTLQAPEFDEGTDRIADAPIERATYGNRAS